MFNFFMFALLSIIMKEEHNNPFTSFNSQLPRIIHNIYDFPFPIF